MACKYLNLIRPEWAVPAAARSQLETMGNDTVNAGELKLDLPKSSPKNCICVYMYSIYIYMYIWYMYV